MKCTKYFLHTRMRPDRQNIQQSWIEETIGAPDKEYIQADGRIRRWKRIPDAGNHVLRVVLLSDGMTVHNAFFDRTYKE